MPESIGREFHNVIWDRSLADPERTAVFPLSKRNCRAVLHQQIENAEVLLPVPSCRVLQIAIDDLEGARERLAQPAHDFRQVDSRYLRRKRGRGRAVR